MLGAALLTRPAPQLFQEAERGFVLLPRWWVVERDFA